MSPDSSIPACKPVEQFVITALFYYTVCCLRLQFQLWTKVLRSKLEHDKSKRSKRHNDVRKRDVMTDGSAQIAAASSTNDYIPPWFHRYVEYKFNLLDRTGLYVRDGPEQNAQSFAHDEF